MGKRTGKTIALILSGMLILTSCSSVSGFLSGGYEPIDTSSGTAELPVENMEAARGETKTSAQEAVTSPAETKPLSGSAKAVSGETETSSEETGSGSIRLCFAGDILLSGFVLNAYDATGNAGGILDETLLDAGRNADIFMANEEFPFGTTGTPAENKQYTFRVDPKRISLFSELGLDIVTLANNHILDYGRDPLSETCAALDGAGISYVGAGENLERASALMVLERKGKKIGFLAASHVYPESGWSASADTSGVFSAYDPADLLKKVRDSESQCDFTVVYLHWGTERKTEPDRYETELAHSLIDAGADLVVGSHPHVLQKIEFYKNKPIAYSLGNYLFGSSIPQTELLCVDVQEDNMARVSVIPAGGSNGKTISTGKETSVTSD